MANNRTAASRRIFFGWTLLALGALAPIVVLLGTTVPLFTLVCLAVPVVSVWRSHDPGRVGFRGVGARLLVPTTALNLALLAAAAALIEPWSHTYEALLRLATGGSHADPTFVWLGRFPGAPGLAGMLLVSGLVTMFAEELFFRGWLLQKLRRHVGRWRAIVIQATVFTLPQLIAAFALEPRQTVLYAGGYAFLGVGCVNGWAAERTGGIWPGLIAAALLNLGLVVLVGGR